MPERNAMADADERAHEIDPAWQFRREGDDSDVGLRNRDLGEDLYSRVLPGVCPGRLPHLVHPRRHAKTRRRLRTAILGVDEIALQVRRKDTRAARPASDSGVS